jgi:flagellar protein FliS
MIDRYRQLDISTSSPVGLVVKLYEGAIRNANHARSALESGSVPERARSIGKALAIVGELQSSLDLEQGGEIAINLNDLYSFVTERLLEANLNARIECIDEAVGVLETLCGGWQEILHSGASAGATP